MMQQGLLSLFLIIYFIVCSGPYSKFRYYSLYATIGLEILFILLWIVAASLSTYTCSDLCGACSALDQGNGYYAYTGDLFCECWLPGDNGYTSFKRDAPSKIFARAGRPSLSGGSGLGKTFEKSVSSATKKGLDATMMFVTLPPLCLPYYQKRS
jgi:hypothetical protein